MFVFNGLYLSNHGSEKDLDQRFRLRFRIWEPEPRQNQDFEKET